MKKIEKEVRYEPLSWIIYSFYPLRSPFASQSYGDNLPICTILPFDGNLEDIPQGWRLCDGTDGTPDLRNRFLQGSDSSGLFIEAGLPNITGSTIMFMYPSNNGVGALSSEWLGRALIGGTSAANGYLYLDASKSNSIYGASDTVQPPAYTVYYIMKVS